MVALSTQVSALVVRDSFARSLCLLREGWNAVLRVKGASAGRKKKLYLFHMQNGVLVFGGGCQRCVQLLARSRQAMEEISSVARISGEIGEPRLTRLLFWPFEHSFFAVCTILCR